MKWLRGVVIAVLVALAFAVSTAASATAAAPSKAFCSDTAELQSWIAQGLQPGIDQYNLHPNRTYVKGQAQYLRKLSGQAPAAVRADLKVWATFTEEVADGASQARLTSGLTAARGAANRVKAWLPTSGCPRVYTSPALPVTHHKSYRTLFWILGGVGVILLLALAGAVQNGGRGGGSTQRRASSSGRGIGSSAGGSTQEKCGNCSGGKITCDSCQGRGTHDESTPQANGVWAHHTGACTRCSRSGKVTCQMCLGTGVRR